jgi:hypothetical protein
MSSPASSACAVMAAWIRLAWPTKSKSNVQTTMPACAGCGRCKRTKCLRLSLSTARPSATTKARVASSGVDRPDVPDSRVVSTSWPRRRSSATTGCGKFSAQAMPQTVAFSTICVDLVPVRADIGPEVDQFLGPEIRVRPQQLRFAGPEPAGLLQHPDRCVNADHARLPAGVARIALDAEVCIPEVANHRLKRDLSGLEAAAGRSGRSRIDSLQCSTPTSAPASSDGWKSQPVALPRQHGAEALELEHVDSEPLLLLTQVVREPNRTMPDIGNRRVITSPSAGLLFPGPRSSTSVEAEVPMEQTDRFCAKCGAALGGEHRFCGHCGERVAAPSRGSCAPVPPPQSAAGTVHGEQDPRSRGGTHSRIATAKTHAKYAIQVLFSGVCGLVLLSAEFGFMRGQVGSGRMRIFILIATLCFVAYFFVVVYAWLRFIATGRDDLSKDF